MSSTRVENSQFPDKKTGSSKRARQKAFILTYPTVGFNASEACRRIGIARQTYTRWLATDPRFVAELEEATETRLDEIEAALMSQIRQGNITGIIFALKTLGKSRGYVEGSPVKMKDSVPSKMAEILDQVLSGEIKPEEAGLELDKFGLPMPEGLKLLIQKTDIIPDPDSEGWNQEQVERELEARYQEQMAKQDQQRDTWLPGRREEVKAIKEELKDQDSFSPEAVKETNR